MKQFKDYPKSIQKRIKARKYMGDDTESWAVFVDEYPAFTSMNLQSVPYYKALAADIMEKKHDDVNSA